MRKLWNIIGLSGCILFLCACSVYGVREGEQTEDQSASVQMTNDTEDEMRREICTIKEIDSEFFTAENTSGELYQISSDYLEERKVNDMIVLAYTERTRVGEHTYRAEVHSVQNIMLQELENGNLY